MPKCVEKKFVAKSNVTVVNPENNLESNHLEYYTSTGIAYLFELLQNNSKTISRLKFGKFRQNSAKYNCFNKTS